MGVEVQDVLRAHGEEFLSTHSLAPQQRRAYEAMLACRTSALGGHVDRCEGCGEELISYNSCRNRHCPKCQAFRRESWVAREGCDLLDVGYYHVVFTVPHELACVFWRNQREMYGLLFRCAWATVAAFAEDPKWLGARTGAVAVLHTWGRQLQYHPHVHMVLGEFSISETGGIDGEPGDQTGRESWVHDYYSGSWDGILHYNGMADVGDAPGVSGSGAPSGDVSELAERVIAGEFGNGDARRAALGSRYDEVQAEVNRILLGGGSGIDVDAMARRVIAGEFGNGDERKRRLGSNYDAVQRRVNEILLGAGTSSTSMDVDAMARAVIRGDYGNGEERRRRLGSYYSIVQSRVNEMLS